MKQTLTGALRHSKSHRRAVYRQERAKAWRPPYDPDAIAQLHTNELLRCQFITYKPMADAFPPGSAAQRAAAETARVSFEMASVFDPYPPPVAPMAEADCQSARNFFEVFRTRFTR